MQAPDQDPLATRRQPPSIATHYMRYSTSNAIVMLADFISFPILTRLLDNTQFGILRYYETWMMIGVAIVKLGAQHAILRFYPYDGDALGCARSAPTWCCCRWRCRRCCGPWARWH